ncbi:hypothetical protein [Selenomonas sp. FOBRC6]|uniref:hypothetical protein n=1 Tax=Selenomonas sp. FOBRC6 TaxID=936572 RepID=UPI001E63F824|nr:hypothetical protein [Selenomonas sp. FOBRC6]
MPTMSMTVPLVEIFASPAFVAAFAPSMGSAYACGAAKGGGECAREDGAEEFAAQLLLRY